jgi:hypothetical protein
MSRVFICYDGRAKKDGTGNAMVLDTVEGDEVAVRQANLFLAGIDCVWFEYERGITAVVGLDGETYDSEDGMCGERMRLDLSPPEQM